MTTHVRRVALFGALLATLGFALHIASARAAESLAAAAREFLAALTPEQQAGASFPLDNDERLRWNFIPNESFPRKGLWLKDLNARQRELALALVRAGLSQRGFATTTAIMELENVVRAMEPGGRFARNPDEYFVSIFGTPDARGTWAMRFEGHHVSLHFAVASGSVTVSTPTFFGTNPAEVRDGPAKGTRILAAEEDAARAVLASLTPEQLAVAIVQADAPRDIVTGNRHPVSALSPAGIAVAALTAAQRKLVDDLIAVYANQMAPDIAAEHWSRIRAAGADRITFAWAGRTEHHAASAVRH